MTRLITLLKNCFNRKSYGVHVECLERLVVVTAESLCLMDRSLENKRPCAYQSPTASRKEKTSTVLSPTLDWCVVRHSTMITALDWTQSECNSLAAVETVRRSSSLQWDWVTFTGCTGDSKSPAVPDPPSFLQFPGSLKFFCYQRDSNWRSFLLTVVSGINFISLVHVGCVYPTKLHQQIGFVAS